DRLHSYSLTGVYELPWGPGKRWMNEGMLGKIIGGWQVSGIFVAQDGTLLNTPGTESHPILTGDNTVLGGLGPGKLYFDPAVYSLPPAGVQGNMTRNAGPEGPG